MLYSTNSFLKFSIRQRYYGDSHFVWCSECFDSRTQGSYAAASLTAPSSNPCQIYSELLNGSKQKDLHCQKINLQKAAILAITDKDHQAGLLSQVTKEDIVYQVTHADFDSWRPLLYIIPRASIVPATRIVPVPRQSCASQGDEFTISDLKAGEFDVIEFV